MERVSVRVDLPRSVLPLLAVLANDAGGNELDRVRRTLQEFADRVQDGVTRPGSWERGWLRAVFYDFESRLVPDPTCATHEQVRP
jgi:hypothetical protein